MVGLLDFSMIYVLGLKDGVYLLLSYDGCDFWGQMVSFFCISLLVVSNQCNNISSLAH